MKISEQNKKWLIFSLVAVFFWGLAAHGYGFLQSSFSGDSLSEFYGGSGSNAWKIQLGRVMVPLYKHIFRTDLTLPWLVGILSLLWIGLAVYLVIRIFRVESKYTAFLIAGIFTVNITVFATAATYSHDFDCDMFALLCAICAACCWREFRWGWVFGALFVALSLGIYQSYISVTIVVIMYVCILELLNGEKFVVVMGKGLKAIGMLLIGGIGYYVLMNLVLNMTNIVLHSGDTNSLDIALTLTLSETFYLTWAAYLDVFSRLLNPVTPYAQVMVKGITILLMLVVAVILLTGLCSKNVKLLEKLLCAGLVVLIPLGMNLIYIPTHGIVHDLMVYAIWLFYLLVLLLLDWIIKRKSGKAVKNLSMYGRYLCMAMIFVVLYGNVQTANVLYLKKDLEQDAYLAWMNRIVYRMENVEGYEAGKTPVVFVGEHQQLNESIPGFEKYRGITGMNLNTPITERQDYRLRTYFHTIMNYPVNVPGSDVFQAMATDPRVAEMPEYPEQGSVKLLDDILVVKLG